EYSGEALGAVEEEIVAVSGREEVPVEGGGVRVWGWEGGEEVGGVGGEIGGVAVEGGYVLKGEKKWMGNGWMGGISVG
ncbi:hypothetical protein, partial [Kocuria salsicia]|uniref:hypothetical protein n=1 Tax=Kocuria salsicia TaxID=664639 RepID=UPI003F68A4FB